MELVLLILRNQGDRKSELCQSEQRQNRHRLCFIGLIPMLTYLFSEKIVNYVAML